MKKIFYSILLAYTASSSFASNKHHMWKEIHEQREAVHSTLNFSQNKMKDLELIINPSVKRLVLLGCGTSTHAAQISKFWFEEIGNISVQIVASADFNDTKEVLEKDALYCVLSQSGETENTLHALRKVKSNNIPVLAITNNGQSSIAREATCSLTTQAGNEVAVAATKSFTTQLAALYFLANYCALRKGIIPRKIFKYAISDFRNVIDRLDTILREKNEHVKSIARKYSQYEKFIFLGRYISYPLAREAALKLTETSYKFTYPCPAGEFKHGPLAMVDESIPVVLFSVLDDEVYSQLLKSARAVKNRRGKLLLFAFDDQDELIKHGDDTIMFPRVSRLLSPVIQAGIMQLFTYHVANELCLPVDTPRGLVKAVIQE